MNHFTSATDQGFDVVVGNPPFLNQLETATTAAKGSAVILGQWSHKAVRGYTDLSAAFLLLSMRLLRSGGRVALVQPQSFLATKDAAHVRKAVLDSGSLSALWVSNEHIFGSASVFTCAPTIQKDGPRKRPIVRSVSGAFTPMESLAVDMRYLAKADSWAHLVAAASGIPEISIESNGVVGDIADATADFRDQYYGLDGFLVEDSSLDAAERDDQNAFPPIVTTGLIDLAACHWGIRSARILKHRWHAPRIDRRRMEHEGSLGPWITQRLVPKVLVATQTRVLEVFVDEDGRFVPSIPLISVIPHPGVTLWHLAAALASPVCTAIGMQKYAGAALNPSTLKLSAKQIRALPLPSDEEAWAEAARAIQDAQNAQTAEARTRHLLLMASASCAAYRIPDSQRVPLLDWWENRLGVTGGRGEHDDGDG